MPPKNWLLKPLEEKSKTGLIEQLNTLWELCYLKQGGKIDGSIDFKPARDAWVTFVCNEITHQSLTLTSQIPSVDAVTKEAVPALLGLNSSTDYQEDVDETLTQLFKWLNGDVSNASIGLWNLARMNFRTSLGGLERKRLNSDGAEAYLRPFTDANMGVWSNLLSDFLMPYEGLAAKSKITDAPIMTVPAVTDLKFGHCQPLTITVEMVENRLTDNPLFNPALVNKTMVKEGEQPKPPLKFQDIGSFGFNEPSYTSYEVEHVQPTKFGYRFNLGARSGDKIYLQHFSTLLGIAEHEQLKTDVTKSVIDKLLELLDDNSMAEVLVYYHAKMLHQAISLIKVRCSNQYIKDWLDTKLARRVEKLEALKCTLLKQKNPLTITNVNQTEMTRDQYFERVGVIESTFWEYAMIAASDTSLANTYQVLGSDITVAGDENFISNTLTVNGETVQRHCFASCFASGYAIFAKLNEKSLKSLKTNSQLADYESYFEFDFIVEASEMDSPVGFHIWLNLPERLKYIAAKTVEQMSTAITNDIEAKLNLSVIEKTELKVVVIDYTKWITNQPLKEELNLLKTIAAQLRVKLQAEQLIFITSTLKYGTGCLERYQRGDVYVFGNEILSFSELNSLAQSTFNDQDVLMESKKRWDMGASYIPLSHRLSAISDYVRSEVYKVALRMKS